VHESTAAQTNSGRKRAVSATEWRAIVAEYQKPSAARASWQLANTLGGYALLWLLMYHSLAVSAWLTAALAILAGGFLVRIFIIFHDCGHGSFLGSRSANDVAGFICGMLTFTPYHHWRWEHSIHHASSGDLDRRGVGDVWTMTVREYLASSRWRRIAYRLSRNPGVLFLLAPAPLFLIRERFPSAKAGTRERASVWWMNLAVAVMVGAMAWLFGWQAYLLIQLTISMVGGAIGVWMFYVQHQFDETYWDRGDDWDYAAAALQGSSFYRLPRILQWFSGNIGFHHVHHLSPRIPNYNLERCHNSHPIFAAVKPLTFLRSLRSINLHLWDEQARRLVSFNDVRGAALPSPAA
jgi:omega-6 fatty acid desaturase (delta-12 desaturase)